MARPDKIDRLPDFLDVLVASPSIAEACRRTGIGESTIMRYLVRSRMGDPELQKVEWMDCIAPFHVHVDQNAPALTATLIERNAMERALNGVEVDVFFQGQRQFERVKKPEFADFTDDDIEALGQAEVAYELRPTKQWLKPSDALTVKMLESWSRRYRPHQEIEVRHGGVLRLERPSDTAKPVKQIDNNAAAFSEHVDEVEQRGGYLALPAPAPSSEAMDAMVSAGEFKPTPVTFVDADGKRTELVAKLPQPKQPKEAPQSSALPGRAGGPDSERIGNARINPKRGVRVA